MNRILGGSLLVMMLGVSTLAQGPVRNVEEDARTLFQHGLRLVNSNPKEALRDFTDVVTGYPSSAVADEALVEIARYHLDVSFDTTEATKAVEMLDKYRASDSAPMSYVLKGRVKLMTSRSKETVDSALTDFDRAIEYGESDFVPAAVYYAGQTLSLARRYAEAVQRYEQALAQYPGSVWSAKSALGAARAFAQMDRVDRAMAVLQRARATAPSLPEAAEALAWNTALYRLHVRPASQQPPFVFNDRPLVGTGGKLKDVVAMGVDRSGEVFAVQKNGALTFDATGKVAKMLSPINPRGIFFTADGRAVFVQHSGLLVVGGPAVPLSIPRTEGTPKPVEEPAAAVALASLASTWATSPRLTRTGWRLTGWTTLPRSTATRRP
jgi:outer membrane protein assembly factor BamD (BamD/ComL family)